MTKINPIQLATTPDLKGGIKSADSIKPESKIFNFENSQNQDFDWDANDGNILFKDAAKSFLTGMGNKAKDQVGSLVGLAKEHPVLATACVGLGVSVGLLATSCAPVGFALGALGTYFGAKSIKETADELKEAKEDLKNSRSDEKTKEILENMGGSTTELIEEGIGTVASAATALSSVKTAVHGFKASQIHMKAWDMLETSGASPFEKMPPDVLRKWESFRIDQGVEYLKQAGWQELLDKAVIAEEASLLLASADEING